MKKEDIPPEIVELLALSPQIQRHERRYRALDWTVPIACLALGLIQNGSVWYGKAAMIGLGFSAGMVVMAACFRRRDYRRMVASVQDLELHIALELEHEETE